jgi:hypothetical protein
MGEAIAGRPNAAFQRVEPTLDMTLLAAEGTTVTRVTIRVTQEREGWFVTGDQLRMGPYSDGTVAVALADTIAAYGRSRGHETTVVIATPSPGPRRGR